MPPSRENGPMETVLTVRRAGELTVFALSVLSAADDNSLPDAGSRKRACRRSRRCAALRPSQPKRRSVRSPHNPASCVSARLPTLSCSRATRSSSGWQFPGRRRTNDGRGRAGSGGSESRRQSSEERRSGVADCEVGGEATVQALRIYRSAFRHCAGAKSPRKSCLQKPAVTLET